ncbi:hypothetical protein PFHG_04642 [Plasmodium falciparum HB3]|nr:hypothetical protein PFHG_04642 [Plasmodium falciparum HB3]
MNKERNVHDNINKKETKFIKNDITVNSLEKSNDDIKDKNKKNSNVLDNTTRGVDIYPPNIRIDENYNDILYLSKMNLDEDNLHLKKIQEICKEIKNNLKYYKAENHDVYKFRPTTKHIVNTNLYKDIDINNNINIDTYTTNEYFINQLNYKNMGESKKYDIYDDKENVKRRSLKIVQEKCKKIVHSLNYNYSSIDINEIVNILNIITSPDFDEKIDKYTYLKLFLNKYHYVYPYENIKGLRKIRKFVQKIYLNKGDLFYINQNHISDMYLKTDMEQIIRNQYFINNMMNLHIDNGKFWIQIVHNIWIPLIINHFNSIKNNIFSYMLNYHNYENFLNQYHLSRVNKTFYTFSQHIFSGILFCGVPSIYRLLMRLHTYKYIELRINKIIENNEKNIYDEIIISSLNYNIDILRTLFPFFKEFINIDMNKIVDNFFESPFFNIIISSLKKSNIEKITVNQKYLNFINSFFLMITEFLYGTANKICVEKINENKIEFLSSLDDIFYDDMNILIARDILLFIIDLLCLFKLHSIYIKKKYCESILHITTCVKVLYYNKNQLTNDNIWKQTYVIAVKLYHFINSALQRKQSIKDNLMIQELTLIKRYYFNNLKQQNSIGDFYFLKNLNYGIYCWNTVCNTYINIHTLQDNENIFQYCQGCYIATYCSEKCKLTHLLSSHHNVCAYFKNIPSFLKFNTFHMEPNSYNNKFLNIFKNIDMFDKNNDKYQVIY